MATSSDSRRTRILLKTLLRMSQVVDFHFFHLVLYFFLKIAVSFPPYTITYTPTLLLNRFTSDLQLVLMLRFLKH